MGTPTGGHPTGGHPTCGNPTGGHPTGGHLTGGHPSGDSFNNNCTISRMTARTENTFDLFIKIWFFLDFEIDVGKLCSARQEPISRSDLCLLGMPTSDQEEHN